MPSYTGKRLGLGRERRQVNISIQSCPAAIVGRDGNHDPGLNSARGPWHSRPRWESAVCASMSTATGIAVVLRLAWYMRWRSFTAGHGADPGNDQLARDCHLEARQVGRYLREAESAGLIRCTRPHAPRRRPSPFAEWEATMPPEPDAAPSPANPPRRPRAVCPADRPAPQIGRPAPDQTAPMSGKTADHPTPASGDQPVHLSMPPRNPHPFPGEQPQLPGLPVGVVGGGGVTPPSTDVAGLVDQLAGLVRGGARTALAARPLVVGLLGDGYTPGELARLVADRTTRVAQGAPVASPVGLLRAILADLPPPRARRPRPRPTPPPHCPPVPSGSARRVEQITAALGPDLYGRLLAGRQRAQVATTGRRWTGRTPRYLMQLLVAPVYEEFGYDLGRIRAYAEQLPPACNQPHLPLYA